MAKSLPIGDKMPRRPKTISPSKTYMVLCFDGIEYYFIKVILPENFKKNDSDIAKFFAMRDIDAEIELCMSFECYSHIVSLAEVIKAASW
jgi:hypothetical protein